MDTEELTSARTLLFVPGHRPDRFAKAFSSGADVVICDLEDAVGPERKAEARAAVVAWLDAHPETVVRINPPDTEWFGADVEALAGRARLIMLPKASTGGLATLKNQLSASSRIVALVETAAGVLHAAAIAADPSVVRLALGNVDLGAELDVSPDDRQALLAARSALVLASAAAGRPRPLDGVTLTVDDVDQVASDMRHAASLGFGGKLCIHPRQVMPTHRALTPTAEQIEMARRVVEAAGEGDVTVLDGRMLDAPVVLRSRRLLDRVERNDKS